MDLTRNVAFLELFLDIISRRTGDIGKVSYRPQKPAFDFSVQDDTALERSTPEREGVPSGWVAGLVRDLGEAEPVHIHQLMILRHGKVIYEGAYAPYRTGIWHTTYSMCKSFAGMAVGILCDEGKIRLSDPVMDYFPEKWNPIHAVRFRDLTIRHLLNMSSGASFNEMGAIAGDDWTSGFFSSSLKWSPGSGFHYNSMNTYLLSAIVTKVTGKTLFAFLQERLFEPMGIRQAFWESTPRGITKGGWGMYLRPEDAAKLGLLYLHKGQWMGRQLISEEWVTEAVRLQISTGREVNPGYGYQVWMDMLPESFVFNGMLGQNVHVFPTLDLILVTNAGNAEIFADRNGMMNRILAKYVLRENPFREEPLEDDPEAYGQLMMLKAHYAGEDAQETPFAPEQPEKQSRTAPARSAVRGGWKKRRSGARLSRIPSSALSVKQPEPAPDLRTLRTEAERIALQAFCSLDGRNYLLQTGGVGLLPLIAQVVHNNYTRGITAVRLCASDEGGLVLQLTEGAQVLTLPIGFGRGKITQIEENGEPYLIGTTGTAGLDETGAPVLTLRISMLEEANERDLKIRLLSPEKIELSFSETPGNAIAENLLLRVAENGDSRSLKSQLLSRLSPEAVSALVRSAVEPVVTAVAEEKGLLEEKGDYHESAITDSI